MSGQSNSPARLLQHRSSPVHFEPPDPREQEIADPYPAPSVIAQAKADMLCARADVLDKLPEADQNCVLHTMDKPSYLELQAIESRYVETVADDAATLLYAKPLDMLDRLTQQRLRDNAAVFVRSRHETWNRFAREMAVKAVEDLLVDDLHKALPHITLAEWHGHAVRCVGRVYGAMRSALASTNGMAPGIYLRLAGQCAAEDAARR